MEFDKKRCLDNIYFLVKELGVKLGELETSAGVSAGYLSRLNKDDSKAIPGADFLLAVADKLGTSVDALMKQDYTALSSSERYLVDFLVKMIEKTEGFEYIWEKIPARKLKYYGFEHNAERFNPMFECREVNSGIDRTTGYPDIHEELVYNSLFHPDEDIGILGDAYVTDLGSDRAFYLVPVGVEENPEEAPHLEYELYLVKYLNTVSKVCHTSYKNAGPFDDLLYQLYTAAEVSSKVPIIGEDVKDVIDEIMNDDFPF